MPKKSYKDYPQEFFAIIKQFTKGNSTVVVEGRYGSLMSTRHQFYRFRHAMLGQVQVDAYAREKSNVIRGLTITLFPTRSSDLLGDATLTFATSSLGEEFGTLVEELEPDDLPPPDNVDQHLHVDLVEGPATVPVTPKTYDIKELERIISGKKKG